MQSKDRIALEKIACDIRRGAVTAVYSGKSGHPGGALSIADVLACLYFREMKIDVSDPKWDGRDRLILSKGHSCPALYAALSLKGFFDRDELKNFRHYGALLQGHPDVKSIPGIDMSSGSLGQGFSVANGMALAGKLNQKDYRVYIIIGDGESEEGQNWEATMFAAHYKLDNLCLIVDNNKLQIDGAVADVMNPMPYEEKYRAFGWNVISVDGHDVEKICDALESAKAVKGKPTVIIADTVKGKGVSYMENSVGWHGKAPNDEQYKQAMADLDKVYAEIG